MVAARVVISAFAALTLSIGIATTARADVIVGAVSATTNMGESFPIAHAIDQSGLTANYISGSTIFEAFVAATAHDSQPGNDWVANSGTGSAVFDLGAPFLIDKAAVWNFGGKGGNTAFSIKDITLEWSLDNVNFSPIGAFTLTQGVAGVNTVADILSFGAVNAEYIRMNVLSNYGSGSALGEIAFGVVPEPGTLALLGLGLAGLASARRRRQ